MGFGEFIIQPCRLLKAFNSIMVSGKPGIGDPQFKVSNGISKINVCKLYDKEVNALSCWPRFWYAAPNLS